MASKVTKKPAPRKRNGYVMAGHIPKGEVLKDTMKNEWVVDTSIGTGGFGEIYSAHKLSNQGSDNYVVKIEPLENGPLFCERTVYIRIGKIEDIEEFMQLRKLKSFGMPRFYGFGTHELNGTKYRFLVMERYGKDLWSLFLENGRKFPAQTVFKVGNQILDVLEYLHSKSYLHADIKGANLLLGRNKGNENQVYLVDFGLASKYSSEYKPNPKKAHNGTLEYTSRDAHLGVATRRGDVEILAYNMLHWLASNLPWESLKDPKSVEAQKNKYMKDVNSLMKVCFKNKEANGTIFKFFENVSKMEPLEEPQYDKLRKILNDGVKTHGTLNSKLDFLISKPETPKTPKSRKLDLDAKIRTRSKSRGSPKTEQLKKKATPKKTTKKAAEKKRTWKDFPTIVNGAKSFSSDDLLTAAKRK